MAWGTVLGINRRMGTGPMRTYKTEKTQKNWKSKAELKQYYE